MRIVKNPCSEINVVTIAVRHLMLSTKWCRGEWVSVAEAKNRSIFAGSASFPYFWRITSSIPGLLCDSVPSSSLAFKDIAKNLLAANVLHYLRTVVLPTGASVESFDPTVFELALQ